MADPRYVNLTAPAGGYESQLADIKRRQKIAELLAQQGSEDIKVESVGGIPTPISPFQGLAKLLKSGMGGYLAGKASEDEAALEKAARTEAIEARKTFNQEPDLVMPGGSARLTFTPGGNDAIPASPELPKYILQDDKAMAAGPQRSDTTLRPFNIMPKEQDVTFGDIITKGAKRSKEDQSRLLDEYEMSDNPYLQKLSERLRTESKGEMFEGNKSGIFLRNADGTIETIVPATNEAADRSPFMQLLIDRDALIASGAKPDDPRVRALDAKINLETTRAPGVQVNMGSRAFENTIGELDKNQLTGMQARATSAQNILNSLNAMGKAADGNIYSGNFAEIKTQYAPLFSWLGVDQNKINNSQEYQAQAGNLALAKIKQLGTNPTDADLNFIKQTIPTLNMQSGARKALIQYLKDTAKNDIQMFNKAQIYYRKNKTMEGFGGETTSGSGDW
jgi:hypothetical protein